MAHPREVSPGLSSSDAAGVNRFRDHLGSMLAMTARGVRPLGVIAATLLGCQALAASTAPQSAVLALLPDQVSGARSSFLKGFALGQASARDCGVSPVRVNWRSLGADQDLVIRPGSQTALLMMMTPFAWPVGFSEGSGKERTRAASERASAGAGPHRGGS